MNVYPSVSSTRSGTGTFEHIENSMRARPYCKRLIDHFLQRSRRIMSVRTRTYIPAVTPSNGGLFPWEAHVGGGILACYFLSTPIMMQTSISGVQDCRLSRYSTTTRPFHLHNELSKTLVGTSMLIHYRLSPNWRLFARLRSTRTFSVNSMPRVALGTAGLGTSPIAMPFPVKVKAPSLKGLFGSFKKRTKTQGQRAPEVQNAVPDR